MELDKYFHFAANDEQPAGREWLRKYLHQYEAAKAPATEPVVLSRWCPWHDTERCICSPSPNQQPDEWPLTPIQCELKRQEEERYKQCPVSWVYERASNSGDLSALCFYIGNKALDILHGPTADYLYPILNAHLLAGEMKPVSLAQCARAVYEHHAIVAEYATEHSTAKAVLDAAGVPYVD